MKTSSAGRAAIAQREGNILKAYPDPATGGEPFTIGVGHTSAAGPPKVTKGMKITAAESDAILTRDLATFEAAVERAVKVPVNQNEFDALVSLAFNIGAGAFAKSTLVKKLNAGDRAGAANAFLSWNRAAGKVMPGLTTRRKAERAQFLAKVSTPAAPRPEPAPEAPLVPEPRSPNKVDAILHRGSRGDFVAELQDHLNILGFGPINVDGEFGYATERAVKAFQTSVGVKSDGWAGPRTLEAIGKAIQGQETAPKLAAAQKVVNDAAAGDKGVSSTEILTAVGGISGAGSAAAQAKDAAENVRGLSEQLLAMGPWVLLALLIAAGAVYVYLERRKKRLNARAVKEVM